MHYKPFGSSGMQISSMALGTWGIGGTGWDDNPESTRIDAIQAAVESGINFFDTAPAYNNGAAERTLGKALKAIDARKSTIIATKCGNEYINGQYVRNGKPEMIFQECEQSLRNLQTDYIDLYLIHWPDPNTPLEATMQALNQLKNKEKSCITVCAISQNSSWKKRSSSAKSRLSSCNTQWLIEIVKRSCSGLASKGSAL